jgi:RNA polymerase sigma-70 factor (ECF subfamily)
MEPSRSLEDASAFRTTRWSCVLALRGANDVLARRALEELCATYWSPLYAYLRRSGSHHADAEDLVQGFLARLVERRDLHLEPNTARLRSYLLGALRHYVANERARDGAARRGGRVRVVAIDDEAAAAAVRDLRDRDTPERAYERRFALALMDAALAKLRGEAVAAGRGEQFDALRTLLSRDEHAAGYAEVALRLGQSAGALRVAAHRLRRRLGELLRAEVAQTISAAPTATGAAAMRDQGALPSAFELQIEAELAHLFEALRS